MDKRKTSKKKTMLEKKPQGNAQLLGDRNIHACNTNLVYLIYIYFFLFYIKKQIRLTTPKYTHVR